ncbi:ATP-grasp domain-containing protein [Neomoorella carbonis]|jgi:succinyl-CoA synthetase beta subunit/citryl-CoA synthetase large subunit|uniref:ATP-grasp domain-containing protein n=1 Tax=Neomoorella carbonis TaxID=3062783 RepID=UPI0032502E7F
MARILENYSLNLLQDAGIPVVKFGVASTPDEAAACAASLSGEVVVKALVPAGKRGKAGAVKFASQPEEVKQAAAALLGMLVRGYPVRKVLVAERIHAATEMYVSISIDQKTACPVVVFSLSGGVDIEEVAARTPEKIVTRFLNPLEGLTAHQSIEVLEEGGLDDTYLRKVAEVLRKLYSVFVSLDATLVEINPLFLTPRGEIVVPACVMKVDDSALFRHQELVPIAQEGSERAWRPLTEIERKVQMVHDADPYRGTARYTELEGGDIGFMCGGGGGSLVLFDELLSLGGKPANYAEFGGNPTEEKVYGLAVNILSKPGVRGLFVSHNITNNTQVDVEARGITRAIKDLGLDPGKFPVVVRAPGVNEAEGHRIFREAGIECYGDDITMTGSAKRMIEKMRQRYQLQEGIK